MALFRRDAKNAASDEPALDEVAPEPSGAAPGTRPIGPWDEADDDIVDTPRVDLGAVRIPAVPGMQLRMEVDQKTGVVTGVSVALGESVLQIQAFAAPRTEGIWDEIRGEIAQSIERQGGTVDDLPGPFGRELLAHMPVRTAEGRTGHRPARFLGADGPRWFLRGVVTGRAAVDQAVAEQLEQVFGQTVVVRGTEARPPRDLLALRMPGAPAPGALRDPGRPEPDFDPLARGPEITEIR
ncbi:MAG: DUF3710 domain-containing protein [Micrococcales bacterium]|nr:DUF3710 domain-containing protein [Micrococcales bacterium]